MNYSVDMIRLKNRLDSTAIDSLFSILQYRPDVEHWSSFKFSSYRHNFRITQTYDIFGTTCENSFYFACQHNSEFEKNKITCVIEYNPNKIYPIELFKYIYDLIFNSNDTYIVSADISIDIPINILDISVDREQRKVTKIFDYGQDDLTLYYGTGNGRVKIYNKKREANLSHELTRYEISLEVKLKKCEIDTFQLQITLPRLFKKNNVYADDSTLDCILFALDKGYDIKKLSRTYRDKVKKLLEKEEIMINREKIRETLITYVKLL